MPPFNHSIADAIYSKHVLKVLDELIRDPIAKTIQRREFSGKQAEKLEQALRALLLNAFYRLDPGDLKFHLSFNRLYRWFIGIDPDGTEWDLDEYDEQIIGLMADGELHHFIEQVIALAREVPPPCLTYEEIADSFERYVIYEYPRPVYFNDYSRSPISEVRLTLIFGSKNGDHSSFETDSLWKQLKNLFPTKLSESEFASNDRKYRLLTEQGNLHLICKDRYRSWEETVRPYIVAVSDATKITNPGMQLSQIDLSFLNLIEMPAEVDLWDYFNMHLTLPAAPHAPQLMQEFDERYEFPREAKRTQLSADLYYSDSRFDYLTITQVFDRTPESSRVALNLEAHWSPPAVFALELVPEIADKLKQDIYSAFHGLITDKMRKLFE